MMNHQRLLVLLNVTEAPPWFIKAVRKVLMWEDDGRDIDPLAQKLWTEITQGADAQDQSLYEAVCVRGEMCPAQDFIAK